MIRLALLYIFMVIIMVYYIFDVCAVIQLTNIHLNSFKGFIHFLKQVINVDFS